MNNEEMEQERKEEHEQEERQNREDEGFRNFKEENLEDLQKEFCKESDEFEGYCRSEFKLDNLDEYQSIGDGVYLYMKEQDFCNMCQAGVGG